MLMLVLDADGYHLTVGSCPDNPVICLCACEDHKTVESAINCADAIKNSKRFNCGPIEEPLPIVDKR